MEHTLISCLETPTMEDIEEFEDANLLFLTPVGTCNPHTNTNAKNKVSAVNSEGNVKPEKGRVKTTMNVNSRVGDAEISVIDKLLEKLDICVFNGNGGVFEQDRLIGGLDENRLHFEFKRSRGRIGQAISL